jgi:2-polyprenyl-3-methyl-5-hydroxy-6-metoxy-1,4-benzoquinol methylase
MRSSDYFVNHARARRFPWSLYHQPIESDLERFLGSVAARGGGRVLVIGCGLLQELDHAPAGLSFTAVDIDPRVIEVVSLWKDPRIEAARVVAADGNLRELDGAGAFDAIYAKEVIEHIVAYPEYLERLRHMLRPGGALWLSTPNYGEPWLPLLERTVLEWVARRSGFSRRHIHPSRFTRRTLAGALGAAGFGGIKVRPVVTRLALVAHAVR